MIWSRLACSIAPASGSAGSSSTSSLATGLLRLASKHRGNNQTASGKSGNGAAGTVSANGSLDVVAGGLNRVDVYKGTGTALATHVPFVVEGDVGDFSVSDFDGDHVLDIAFRATHPQVNQTTTATSDLDVMWGNLFGVPNEPRFIGQFSKIIGSQHGLTTGDIGNNDAISDLGVVTQTQISFPPADPAFAYDVSVLAGSPTRHRPWPS